jgi:hypothetical protein
MFIALLLLSFAGVGQADECANLLAKTAAFDAANEAMSGHFNVPLASIQYCGVYGWSKLYTASVDTYQKYKGWEKSGELRCWQFSDHVAGTPYGCGRKIISAHSESQIEIVSKYEIPLEIIDEAAFALDERLTEGDEIESMDYVPVDCGGTWSIAKHGYMMKLKSVEQGVTRRFVVKKNCSPTPCLWEVEELKPER